MWPRSEVVTEDGMVTSFHPQATMAGVEILRKGGNSVDAAVATSLALGVAEPAMSGLGGRNYAVLYIAESEEIMAIDANVRSGSKAKPGVFEPISTMAPEGWPRVKGDANATGYMSICVPGNVACLSLTLEEYGSMGWQEVTQPAIRIAQEGYDVYEPHVLNSTELLSRFPESAKTYLKPDGSPNRPGERARNRDLAESLRRIAEGGSEAFYRGEIAEAIVRDMEENNGLITGEDLRNYEPSVTRAGANTYRGYEFFYTLGASGGPTLMETLNIIEGFDLARLGKNTPECIHVIAESMKLAYADRFEFLADPASAEVPMRGMVSKEYAAKQRRRVDPKNVAIRVGPGDPWGHEDEETTHLSVIDKDRNMVSMTQSIHSAFGSGVVITGTGIIMNNGMKRFNPLSGFAASIEPDKRPLSYQSPILVFGNGEPFMSLGAPGGSRIPTTLAQVIVNMLDHGMSIQEAINAPKFHCENGEPIFVESAIPFEESVIIGLKRIGHDIGSPWPGTHMASPNGIVINPETGMLYGGVDPRRPGLAAGP